MCADFCHDFLLSTVRVGGDPHLTRHRLHRFLSWCIDSAIPELLTLATTIDQWWPQIHAFVRTGITNARTEGYNRLVKQVKRVGCGFRNRDNSARRIRMHCTRRARRGAPHTWCSRARGHQLKSLHACTFRRTESPVESIADLRIQAPLIVGMDGPTQARPQIRTRRPFPGPARNPVGRARLRLHLGLPAQIRRAGKSVKSAASAFDMLEFE